MLVDVPLSLEDCGIKVEPGKASPFHVAWERFYAGSKVVIVADETGIDELLLKSTDAPTDRLELHAFFDQRSQQARLVARLDNLGKGAAGAALQNLNIMCGLPETAGLRL